MWDRFIWLSKNYDEPFPKRQILDDSKLKGLADDNFKSDENGRKLPKWEENTVGKGEIARYEQFLLFPQCFQRHVLQTHKNQGLFGKGLMQYLNKISFYLVLSQRKLFLEK